jgi:hypothetical protein
MKEYTMSDQEPFTGWAVIDILGHQRIAGQVREQTIAGAAMLRCDIPPDGDYPGETVFQSPGSIYSIRPCTEQVARIVAKTCRPAQITRWDLPPELRKLLPGGTAQVADDDPYDDEPIDDREDDDDDRPFD